MIDRNDAMEAKFTLESERGGIVEEPPFRILVLGDWSGDAERRPVEERTPIEIDRDNFDATIARLRVRLDLEMEGGMVLPIDFADLDDFHPDQIFRRVPAFSELRDLRKRLKSPDDFHQAAREVRDRMDVKDERVDTSAPEVAPSADEPPGEGDLLDAILTKPSGGAAAPKPGISTDLGHLVNDLVRPYLVSVDENEQSQMLAAVDAATSDLMRGILHDLRFQELEAAWRGLFFLVRRTETSPELKIHLYDISKSALTDNLKSISSLQDSLLYRHLIRDAIETPGGEPWAVTLGNYAFEPNVEDIASLIRISKLSAAANAPFISHIRPDVFGVSSLASHPDPADWNLSAETDEGKLWSALRGQAEAEFLGMCIPRFLSRLPYGAETDPVESFDFEEFADSTEHDHYLWSNPCFAAGQLLAESFSAYGWKMGKALRQDIEGLPIHVYKEDTETVYKPCSEVLLTQNACERLMEYGLMPLVSYKNTDKVKLARFQSVADTALRGMWS